MTALATNTQAAVTVPRSELARALRAASSIKAKNVEIDLTGSRPVIAGYTDALAIETTLDVQVVENGGKGSVPRAVLAGILPYLGPDVDLAVSDDRLTVTSGESTFEIHTLRPGSEPEPNVRRRGRTRKRKAAAYADTYGHKLSARGELIARIEAPVLVEALRRTLPFASRDQTRPVLATVALYPDANTAAATDSYRLAIVRYGDENGEPVKPPVLIHVDAGVSLQRLLAKKLGQVRVRGTKTHYLFAFEDVRWSVRRQWAAEGEEPRYPNVWSLVGKASQFTAAVKVDRDDLLAAARAGGVVGRHNSPLRLNVDPIAGARITAKGIDVAAMDRRLATADVTGEAHEIGLNPEFLAAICAVAPVERLTLRLISPLHPLLVEAARDQYLLMPIRLNV